SRSALLFHSRSGPPPPSPLFPSTTLFRSPTVAPVVDHIEFRVFGATLLTPGTIKPIDPVTGLPIVTTSPPYFAAITSTDRTAFVYLEASAFGVSTSTLQVQIFQNGRLFREGSSFGSVLFAQASGTVQH